MAAHQVGLQLRQVLMRNAHIGQLAEARVHAIDGLPRIENFFDRRPARRHARAGFGRDLDAALASDTASISASVNDWPLRITGSISLMLGCLQIRGTEVSASNFRLTIIDYA